MKSGIYSITNIINKKRYIGKAFDIYGRWENHIKNLNKNIHFNKYLQAAWNKDRMENFRFEILRLDEKKELNQLEKDFIYLFRSNNDKYGYNLTEGGDGGEHKFSDETKQKISEAQKGEKHYLFGKHHSEETKKKMSDAHKGENHFLYGKHHSEETKLKISLANKGKKRSEEIIQKMSEIQKGAKNGMFGRHHSEETKLKISKSRLSKNLISI